MEFKNVSINLKNSNLLRFSSNKNLRKITIDPRVNQGQNSEVTLICYKIHLIEENEEIFAYLLKNILPTSSWYAMKIRDGDRLITLNGQDVIRMSYEEIYSIMIEKKLPFTCQLVWHPELYIEIGNFDKTMFIDHELNNPIRSERLITDNMYEYLTRIIRNLLDYRPNEPCLLFKNQEVSSDTQTDSYSFAQRQLTLLSNHSTIEGNSEETMRNIFEVNCLFERCGIGLNRDEIYWVWISMKVLLNEKPSIQKLRFWGKIFGLKNNYYIAEADFDTYDDDLDLNDSEFVKYQEAFSVDEENETEDQDITNINRKVPPEPIGNGVNQKVFYVSSGIDKPFVQLPLVTPEQIELSRKIQQFFTGDLEVPVRYNSTLFPGVEKHLLRAQIQRISAGTQIGPKNSFQSSVNEEEEETIEPKIKFDMNNELEDLAQSNGQYWIHYVPYINQQGRNENSQIEFNAFHLKPVEHNPSIDQDTSIDGLHPAWSVAISSTLVPEHALVYVRSNRWPGAFTVGDRSRFENIYIGWGVKNFIENHQANMINIFPENEYAFEIMEIDDPTIDEENDLFKSALFLSPDENEEFEID